MTAARAKGKVVGYIRVSSVDQNTERQLDGVHCDKMFTDKCSGKDTDRPQLQAALNYLREGDTLVCHSMDRLSRNLHDLSGLVKRLTADGIAVRFHSQSLTFTGDDDKMAELMLGILGAVAQFERAMIRERQAEGIAKAKKKGVYRGGKAKLDAAQADDLREKAKKATNKAALAREYGISRETLYQYLNTGKASLVVNPRTA
jgi:DNA invertase Pin-like site-specific DNA recombinase